MPRLLEHVRILVYYDGPQLIVAVDLVGTKYLCMLTEELEEKDKFVCAPISNGRLRAFERGELDLLQIFSEPETGELYEGDSEYSADAFLLAITLAEQIPEYWYPEEGFFLAPVEDITAEARDRNKAVVHLALQPPEAREGTQIDVQHLANGLHLYQRFIRHAYDKAVLAVRKDIRDEQSLSDASNYQMEVFAFSPGSFAVDMQSKTSADMLGYVNLARALTLVDEAVTAANDPEAATAFMREHRGRFSHDLSVALAVHRRKRLSFDVRMVHSSVLDGQAQRHKHRKGNRDLRNLNHARSPYNRTSNFGGSSNRS